MNWGETMPPPVEAGRELAFDWPIPATTIVVRDRAGDMPLPCDLPPWTWHAVAYDSTDVAVAASLFHFVPSSFIRNQPAFAVAILPNLAKELVGVKTQ